MELLLIWIPASIATGVYAARKGRSGFGVFLLSVLLSPIVGLLVAVAMKDRVAERRHQELVAAITASGAPKSVSPEPEYVYEHVGFSGLLPWKR